MPILDGRTCASSIAGPAEILFADSGGWRSDRVVRPGLGTIVGDAKSLGRDVGASSKDALLILDAADGIVDDAKEL